MFREIPCLRVPALWKQGQDVQAPLLIPPAVRRKTRALPEGLPSQ